MERNSSFHGELGDLATGLGWFGHIDERPRKMVD